MLVHILLYYQTLRTTEHQMSLFIQKLQILCNVRIKVTDYHSVYVSLKLSSFSHTHLLCDKCVRDGTFPLRLIISKDAKRQ